MVASSMFNGMFETVRHDMPREKANSYMNSLREFYSAGWFRCWGSVDHEKKELIHMEKKEPSPISVVWGWAEKYHSKFYGSVVLAVLGVAGTMLAYFSIAAMIRILLENGDFSQCLPWCGFLLIG